MKKLLSVLLVVVLIITAMPLDAFEFKASAETSGYYTYSVSNDKATITYCNRSISGNVTIPSTLGGYPVTRIGMEAFYYCSSLTSITIPNSVTSIGMDAFYGCYSLENVYITDIAAWCNISFDNFSANPLSNSYYNEPLDATKRLYINRVLVKDLIIPSGVTSIGDYSFSGCSSIENVIISDSVMSIGNRAFDSCGNLISVDIGDNVSNIADYAFYGCSSLTNVIIPGSVTKIGNSVFRYCARLTSITIPDSVTNIGELAFDECDNLEKVYITNINAWCNIDFDFDFSSNELSKNKYSSNPLYYADYLFLNNKPVTNITVSEGITEITPYIFDFCTLKKITLPEGVTTIGANAFASCEILTEINIPSSVKSIDNNAFCGCESLETVNITDLNKWCEINFEGEYSNPLIYAENLYLNGEPLANLVIPEGMTEIPSYLFSSATIKSVAMPNTVIKIGDYAFKNCSGLESISIPNSVTNIGNNAFENCTSLKRVFLGKEYMIVKNGTFKNCNNITDIYYEGTEEDWESVAILLNNGSLANAKVTFNATGLPNDSASIIGDINGDEAINLKDLVTIAQYVANWENIEVNEKALDINDDGIVDLTDVQYLARYLAGWEEYGKNIKLVWPVPGYYNITSYYGYRINPVTGESKLHGGIDIASAGIYGKAIVAAADGVVVSAGWNSGGFGNWVIINHGTRGANQFATIYAHMCRAPVVSAGQSVKAGQTIGYVGSTGNSTGNHLHFEVRVNGSRVNPMSYFN